MDPESPVAVDLKDSSPEVPSVVDGKGFSEKPSLPSPASDKNLVETLPEKDAISPKVPIAPAVIREVEIAPIDVSASMEMDAVSPKVPITPAVIKEADIAPIAVSASVEMDAVPPKFPITLAMIKEVDIAPIAVSASLEMDAVPPKVPITPVVIKEVDIVPIAVSASPETPGGLKGESVGEDAGDGRCTPKRLRFDDAFDFESDEDDGDGCSTPRSSVFDAFAPCKICPKTPGPVIPQRIRLF